MHEYMSVGVMIKKRGDERAPGPVVSANSVPWATHHERKRTIANIITLSTLLWTTSLIM